MDRKTEYHETLLRVYNSYIRAWMQKADPLEITEKYYKLSRYDKEKADIIAEAFFEKYKFRIDADLLIENYFN